MLPALPACVGENLVANVVLRGYMPSHLDFTGFYAQYSGLKRRMKIGEVIHGPTKIQRWNVPKGPFVHDKTKEIFERMTYERIIQVFDTDDACISAWVLHLKKNLPPGIEMQVETYQKHRLSEIPKLMQDEPRESVEESFDAKVKRLAKEFVENKKL